MWLCHYDVENGTWDFYMFESVSERIDPML